MPSTRSTRTDESGSRKSENTKNICADLRQWVCLAPDSVVGTLGDQSSLIVLPHPKSGRPTQYVHKDASIYEITQFKPKYQSWFIDQTVQKDGSMFIWTKLDALLLVLPYLTGKESKGKFSPLGQVLFDEKYPHLLTLERCLSESNLINVCDGKDIDGATYYRINEEKLHAWLKLKISRLASSLADATVCLSTGSQIASFQKHSADSKANKDDAVPYALGMLCDYLPPGIAQDLQSKLGLQAKNTTANKASEPPPAKKPKTVDPDAPCLEDYRLQTGLPAKKKEAKMTAAQKSLAKVNKKGMKTMGAFFSAKPK